MITASKIYLSENQSQTIWSQDQKKLIGKIEQCVELNDEYHRCFKSTKEKLESDPSEQPFNFSEMYIFSKFDSFTNRCKRIVNIFETIERYSSLAESKVEGLPNFYLKFNMILVSLKKKNRDFFDQRRQEIDEDINEFNRSIEELNSSINEFLDKQFNSIRTTERALAALQRYEKLKIENLGIKEKYSKVVQQFSRDLNLVAKSYQKHRNEPPLPRNLPPITGKNLHIAFAFI